MLANAGREVTRGNRANRYDSVRGRSRSHARQSRKSLRFGSRPEQKKKNPAPIGALYMRNPFLWRLAERALERSTRASIGKARLTAGPSLRSRKEDLNDQIAS